METLNEQVPTWQALRSPLCEPVRDSQVGSLSCQLLDQCPWKLNPSHGLTALTCSGQETFQEPFSHCSIMPSGGWLPPGYWCRAPCIAISWHHCHAPPGTIWGRSLTPTLPGLSVSPRQCAKWQWSESGQPRGLENGRWPQTHCRLVAGGWTMRVLDLWVPSAGFTVSLDFTFKTQI